MKNKLLKPIYESLFDLTDSISNFDEQDEVTTIEIEIKNCNSYEEIYLQIATFLRSMQLWFQAAHHCVDGLSFIADHQLLFSDLYTMCAEEFDSIVEKSIGKNNNKNCANLKMQLEGINFLFSKWKEPSQISTQEIFEQAKEIELLYQELLKSCFEKIQDDILMLGLNDWIMTSISQHEDNLYKINARIKC